ncbi:putative ATP-dependent endonuclease of OLD family [Salinibacter ruber]|uniref:ATP-dependent nuclease n=1 Tax=Salinibacter ruber TaxID=146919 RepID=UPI002167F1EF|nr:putative ATP-dependent endonuclease of OLD family [Salinibacter ruber]
MEIESLRIRNFRTIKKEQKINLGKGLTIVGPNNSGKTNILKAIELLFTGRDNKFGYPREHDLTFWLGRKQTSLVAVFNLDKKDDSIKDKISSLQDILGVEKYEESFAMYLSMTESNNSIYKFFPNEKRPTDTTLNTKYSRIKNDLIDEIIDSFTVYYVPSAKSMEDLYEDIIVPVTKDTAAKALEPSIEKLKKELNEVSDSINNQLDTAGLENISASFRFPGGSARDLLSGFELRLEDPSNTSIFRKGMGIQSMAIMASFMWITRQEKDNGNSVVWMLEEPESYLHPELADSCRRVLDRLNNESTVVSTTHSIGFVPSDPNRVVGTELVGEDPERRTEIKKFTNYYSATQSLRNSLGVKFSDFYNLSKLNVFVEGPSDRELIKWFLKATKGESVEDLECSLLRESEIYDFGGVSQLEGFLKATWRFIHKERAAVSLFDGDEAGVNARSNLQSYFGQNEIRFETKKDFLSVRKGFAIEGLFPDDWIKDIYSEKGNWFDEYSEDAMGNLEPFGLRRGKADPFRNRLVRRAESQDGFEWAGKWISVCNHLHEALRWQADKLGLELH